MSPNFNHAFISLIPKIKNPEKAKDFRLISLCNVLYKIIAKTIANHFKKLLPKLVSETQSAYMSNRLISDNILVAFETLHHLKSKRRGKSEFMVLKLDMSKAYDRVEWIFLEKIIEKLGFNGKWISLISSCIHSVSFSIMINGKPHGHFHPQRGLRQGGPLSPYLFLLCAEGLHSLIQQAKNSGTLNEVSLRSSGPKVSHLFFANDSSLFARANLTNCSTIMDILAIYKLALG